MHSVPMKIPRVCLRITACHSVFASRSPRTGYQGRGGSLSGPVTPVSISRFSVAT